MALPGEPIAARLRRALAPGRPVSASDALVGIGVAVAATVFRIALDPWLGDGLPYVTFYPAVALGAWAAGLVGGLVALGSSGVVADLLFLQPVGSLAAADWVGLGVFLVSGALISLLGGQLHGSRFAAEQGRARAAFLADASAVLVEQIDPLATAEGIVRLAVPRFADWCAIELLDRDGRLVDRRLAATDARLADLVRALREYPIEPDAAGTGAVARTGVPELARDVPPGRPGAIGEPLVRALAGRAPVRSYLAVPLEAPDGRRVGVLSAAMIASGRRFSDEDLATAIDLGRRTGVALDHAALFAEVEERRDELDGVIRVMGDPVLVAHADGTIRSRNAAADAVLGPVAGVRFDDVLAALRPIDGRADARQVVATGRYVVPIVVDVETRGEPARVAVLRDVTDVLESEAARDAFVSMLSHELRTPITTIFGTAQMLGRPLAPEPREELIADLTTETDRLYRLVEDLLVLSRFERGRLDIASEPVLVQRVVGATLDRATAQHKGLRVEVTAPSDLAPALADPTYLEQVIRNLASNAVKYAGERALIRVAIEAVGAEIRITFEDDGPGIPEDEVERVFALYERLSRHGTAPGAGIGLFVCRRLVEAMGGEISVRRGATGGACFELTLPIVEDVPAARPVETG